ncbi:uncharacterized protein N7500_001474 [Penicillium coprophilum]|uniref:uncharacterized protein n=1 Tax=Penicillium coprophilum TaxID=36646 RepID=UPI00239636F3|nr:uncharacterized protein N7500_001474 [Penicillium coprophilum]KAJ5173543.1 hypothetical protein N7500_001474 [Penicillium coprophilum]
MSDSSVPKVSLQRLDSYDHVEVTHTSVQEMEVSATAENLDQVRVTIPELLLWTQETTIQLNAGLEIFETLADDGSSDKSEEEVWEPYNDYIGEGDESPEVCEEEGHFAYEDNALDLEEDQFSYEEDTLDVEDSAFDYEDALGDEGDSFDY